MRHCTQHFWKCTSKCVSVTSTFQTKLTPMPASPLMSMRNTAKNVLIVSHQRGPPTEQLSLLYCTAGAIAFAPLIHMFLQTIIAVKSQSSLLLLNVRRMMNDSFIVLMLKLTLQSASQFRIKRKESLTGRMMAQMYISVCKPGLKYASGARILIAHSSFGSTSLCGRSRVFTAYTSFMRLAPCP